MTTTPFAPVTATPRVWSRIGRTAGGRAPGGRRGRYSPLSRVRVPRAVPPTRTRAAGTGDASLVPTPRPRTLWGVCAGAPAAGTSHKRNRTPAGWVIRPSERCGKTVLLGGRQPPEIGKSHADASRVARRSEACESSREAEHAPYSRPQSVPLVGDRGPERCLFWWGRWGRPKAVRRHRAGGGRERVHPQERPRRPVESPRLWRHHCGAPVPGP